MSHPGRPTSAKPRRGPIPAPLGLLLAPVYERIIASRNRRFDRGERVHRFDRPVISVGNLSVGGTGKTPTVRRIVEWLIAQGRTPAIAMRGYKAAPGRMSDEAIEYQRTLAPWQGGTPVPIVAQPDRVAGLERLLATPTGRRVNRIVLDDGFQHRRIARDLDVVLIDATRSPWDDRLLPAGWLREPVESLSRASAVVITHAEAVEPARVEELAGRASRGGVVVATARHEWTGVHVREGARVQEDEPERAGRVAHGTAWLKGKRAFAVCAIANPGPFVEQLRRCCADVPGELVLGDHDAYEPATVERLLREAGRCGADVIVTTEKDWAKLSEVPAERWPAPVACPRLDIVLERGEAELRSAVAGL